MQFAQQTWARLNRAEIPWKGAIWKKFPVIIAEAQPHSKWNWARQWALVLYDTPLVYRMAIALILARIRRICQNYRTTSGHSLAWFDLKLCISFNAWAMMGSHSGWNEPLARWWVPSIWQICKLLSAGVPSRTAFENGLIGHNFWERLPEFCGRNGTSLLFMLREKRLNGSIAEPIRMGNLRATGKCCLCAGENERTMCIYIKTFNPIPTIKSTNFNNFAFDLSQLCIMSLKNSIYNFCAYFSLAECRTIVSVVGCARAHMCVSPPGIDFIIRVTKKHWQNTNILFGHTECIHMRIHAVSAWHRSIVCRAKMC